tara:strand:+ start:385 stop:1227 length:843 start_codon:yes stop_codon:yes gene_type:complete
MAAHFPILSRQIALTGNIGVGPVGSPTDVSVTTTGVWSFASASTGAPSSDSLAYHLGTQIDTVVAGTYTNSGSSYSMTTHAYPAYKLEFASAVALEIVFGSSDAVPLTEIGVDGTSMTSTAPVTGDVMFTSQINCAGWWSAGIELTRQNRPDQHDYEDFGSVYDGTADETEYYGSRQRIELLWEQVEDANVYLHRATDATYAALAGRNTADPNGLINDPNGMLEYFCRGETFRIYFGHGDYITVRKQEGGRIRQLSDWVTEYPDDPRRSTVRLRGWKVVS